MSVKTIGILFIGFLVVTFVAIFPSVRERIGWDDSRSLSTALPFQEFTKDSTKQILIQKDNVEFSLVKEGGQWKVASYSAHQPFVEAFFSALLASKPSVIVSKNEAYSDEYGVSSRSGIFLTLQDTANKQKTFIIGDDGPEMSSFYAKQQGSNFVYLVKGPLRDSIKTRVNDWRNNTIIELSQDDIHGIELKGSLSFALVKKDKEWEMSFQGKTRSFANEKISPILSRISFLQGRDFLTEEEQKQFTAGKVDTLVMKDKEQKVLSDISFMKKDGEYWMKKSDSADMLKVSSYMLEDLIKLASP
ncbi:MAG: DUF4340 domain-containing protein [Patescibacteria group bacterium]|nr:DUF4340 domain-containing protein [Patescibacteria group bacterium]